MGGIEGPGPGGWLHEQLFERRIVVVSGPLDDTVAGRAAAALMALDAAGAEAIDVHVDCPDSTLEAAFMLIDVIDLLQAPVRAHCRGQAGGPAVGVVALAPHRSAAPHATFRLAQPVTRFTGTPEQIVEQSRRYRDVLWRLQARLATVTGKPAEEIGDDMRRGRVLDAPAAVEYGLIDTIGRGLDGRPFGV
jgi:ATP-dependent Clp protease protease subunit